MPGQAAARGLARQIGIIRIVAVAGGEISSASALKDYANQEKLIK